MKKLHPSIIKFILSRYGEKMLKQEKLKNQSFIKLGNILYGIDELLRERENHIASRESRSKDFSD